MRAPAAFLLLLGTGFPLTTVAVERTHGASDAGLPQRADRSLTQIAPGESKSLAVPLHEGDFVHAEILQTGVALSARLLAPDGSVVAATANPTEDDEPLPLSAIAANTGGYQLVLSLDRGAAVPTLYTVILDTPRPAVSADLARIEAERLFEEGQRLRADGSKEALQRALVMNAQAAAKATEGGDRVREAYAHAQTGEVHWLLGDLGEASREATRAVQLWRELGVSRELAGQLVDLCVDELDAQEPQAALEHCREALTLVTALGDEGPLLRKGDRALEGAVLHNLGSIYLVLREKERAIEFLRRALVIARSQHRNVAVTLDQLGGVYYELGAFETSLRLHQEALAMRRASGDRRGQAVSLTSMGWNRDSLGQRKEALALYRQALELTRAVGDRREEAITLVSMGQTLSLLGRDREALACHQEALTLSHQTGDREQVVYALEGSARVLSKLGRPAEALPLIEEALTLTEETRTRITETEHRASYAANARVRYDLLVDVLFKLHQAHPEAGYDARALLGSERARARGLLDLLAEAHTDLREGVDPALLARERAAEDAVEQKATEQATEVASGKGRAPQALERETQMLAAELQEVRGLIRAHSPHYAALVSPQPLDLARIQREVLDGDTLLLEYHLGDDRSFLWAVGSNSLVLRQLPRRATIEAAVRRLHHSWSLGGSDPETANKLAASVSRMLLGPVADLLGTKRLVVVADGALLYLPFAALPVPGRGATLVVDEHEIVALPSASTLSVLRQESRARQTAPLGAAVFADPVFDARDARVAHHSGAQQVAMGSVPTLLRRSVSESGLSALDRLRGSRREADAILALLPPTERFAAFDFQANRLAATSPALARYRVVHFATHGLLNSRSPDLSGLVLSLVDETGRPQNGFLRTNDVFGLRLGADLVVLSACQTALGQEVRGEGLVGLTRAFMYAGALRVLASLWRVPDAATAELMAHFYRAMLVDGLSPAAALRSAQVALKRQRRFADPEAWAAFTLQGDWK